MMTPTVVRDTKDETCLNKDGCLIYSSQGVCLSPHCLSYVGIDQQVPQCFDHAPCDNPNGLGDCNNCHHLGGE